MDFALIMIIISQSFCDLNSFKNKRGISDTEVKIMGYKGGYNFLKIVCGLPFR